MAAPVGLHHARSLASRMLVAPKDATVSTTSLPRLRRLGFGTTVVKRPSQRGGSVVLGCLAVVARISFESPPRVTRGTECVGVSFLQ
jgi:hypothetical protein